MSFPTQPSPGFCDSTQGLHPAPPPQGHVPQRVTSLSPLGGQVCICITVFLSLPAPRALHTLPCDQSLWSRHGGQSGGFALGIAWLCQELWNGARTIFIFFPSF